jgi:hypothetical protein
MARDATLGDAEVIQACLREVPVAAFHTAKGWSRRRVRSHYLATAKRWDSLHKSPRFATVT